MSLIMDATKAAQREKARREGTFADRVPVLVPLKTGSRQAMSWKLTAAIAIVGAVVLSAGVLVYRGTRDTVPRSLALGPTVSSIVTPKEPVRQAPAATSEDAPPASKSPSPPVNHAPASASQRSVATRAPARRAPSTTANNSQLRIAVEDPRQPETARLFALAVDAHRAGDLSGARAAYQRVLAASPNDADAMNNLGVLLTAQREFDKAETLLRRSISLSPASAGAWNNLGAVLRERGRSGEAIAAFQRALTLDPKHVGARVSLAQQYVSIGSHAQARQLLESVLQTNPALPEATYALGQALEQLGDRAGAVRAYQSFIDSAPPALASYVENVRRRVEVLTTSR